MRIEKKSSYYYIADDVWPQRIKLYLGKALIITSNKLLGFTKKYISLLHSDENYQSFTDGLYNQKTLEKILNISFRYSILYNCENMGCNIDATLLHEKSHIKNYFEKNWILDFVFNSNKIEGSKIPKEYLIKVWENKSTKYQNKNEIKEIQNTIKAFAFLDSDFMFNERSIKRLYHILTKGLYMPNSVAYPQGYKKIPIIVGNSPTTSPEEVKNSMKNLLTWYQSNKNKMFPIQLALDFHFMFEKIHPFTDGNGRIGRMLMNKILKANKFLPFTIFDINRNTYFNVFEKTEIDKKKYYKFMLEQYYKTIKL